MNIKTLVSAAVLSLFAAGAFAQAASTPKVDKRQDRQEARVQQGAASGSLTAMRRRVIETLHTLASRHVGEQIVMVAHGGVMDLLYRAATGQELQAPRTWQLGNTAINRLLWTPDGLTLVGWSDTSHLDDESLDESTT